MMGVREWGERSAKRNHLGVPKAPSKDHVILTRAAIPRGYAVYDMLGIGAYRASMSAAARIYANQRGVRIIRLRELRYYNGVGKPVYRWLSVLPVWAFQRALRKHGFFRVPDVDGKPAFDSFSNNQTP